MSKAETVYVAQMETTSFSFTALGSTEEEAKKALERGWNAHAEQYGGAREGIFTAWLAMDQYGVNIFQIEVGGCARDYSALTSKESK